jgi:hypothetical protein
MELAVTPGAGRRETPEGMVNRRLYGRGGRYKDFEHQITKEHI